MSSPEDPGFEPVVPDQLFRINIEDHEARGAPDHVMVNGKYDRIDYLTRYGQYVLKAFDDEIGLMTMYIDEATALRVQEYAGLPIVPRDQIYRSEYEAYINAQAEDLESWLDDKY